jgi:Na+-translocating ferredoxin:NAD+ oxidoreductase RNF subunit RnfB
MDEHTCMVEMAKYFIEFSYDESCGKCTSCRDGSAVMLEILRRICDGKGQEGDVELLAELGKAIQEASLCGLGQSLPNPVVSAIEHFRDEFKVHITEKRCPGGICKALITYSIDTENCTGCTLCAKKCPSDAITGEAKKLHTIIEDKCIKCGICRDACKFDAVIIT